MNTTLVINPELRDLLPPLSPKQFAKLEAEIVKDGCTAPLIVWGNVIVDGHHRHKICIQHDIDYQTKQKTFESLDEAKLWMWQNQNSRRNLSRFQRAEIALKMKEVVATQAKDRQIRKPGKFVVQNSAPQKKTRQILAEFADVSHDTLDRVEFLLKHADKETINMLRWDKKGTSINKEYTRLKAAMDAEKPKTEKKSREKSTSNQSQEKGNSNSTDSETKTSGDKTAAAQPDPEPTSTSGPEAETSTSDASPETVTVSLKSSPKVKEQYCCGLKFEPEPDDDFFDWITDEEREELKALNDASPNRLVPQIHNFTIQNIPEHSAEPLIDCLYSLFKAGYRRKLVRGLLRRMFAEDDRELTRALVSEFHEEFQN